MVDRRSRTRPFLYCASVIGSALITHKQLLNRKTAVHAQHLTGHERSTIGAKKQHRACDFLGLRGAPDGMHVREPRLHLFVVTRKTIEHVSYYGPGRNNVDSEGVREAVPAGLGVGFSPAWLFADELRAKSLRLLLPNYRATPMPIHGVSLSSRRFSAKIKALLDYLEAEFEIDAYVSAYGHDR